MEKPLLKVENLSIRRNGKIILDGVNLEVAEGEIHVLLGLNGSGKSSLAYAIMGCESHRPDTGRILFDGKDITHTPIDERARMGITLAWQEPARFEGITVYKYVGLGIREKKKRDRVIAALSGVSLLPKVYMRRAVDDTLSGGERKRIELAAVYAMRPRLAILDEPDSGIDVLSLDDITALVRQMKEEGITVLLITHRDELVNAADRASLMCRGKIVRTGRPEEVRAYFGTLCKVHGALLGPQPWQDRMAKAGGVR